MIAIDAHDPSASATIYPQPPAPQIRLSRNEVETLCLKAARGAGMPWGLAEEAGFAAGWLAARGVDGASVLLAHLKAWPEDSHDIVITDRMWSARSGGGLCPIAFGAALDDHAGLADGVGAAPLTLPDLRHPGLAVPLLARLARASNMALALAWDGGTAQISAMGEMDLADLRALFQVITTRCVVRPCSQTEAAVIGMAAADIAPLSSDTLAGLNALAMRTTVPASEQSRRGAGASANDND